MSVSLLDPPMLDMCLGYFKADPIFFYCHNFVVCVDLYNSEQEILRISAIVLKMCCTFGYFTFCIVLA